MKAEGIERALEVGRVSTHAIDEYHRAFLSEVCESGRRLELLIDLDRTEELGLKDEG
jgi:hypothetical protein